MVKVTPENEPFVDLVQIRAQGAFGTGLLVGRGLVLTALHVAADADRGWQARPNLGVNLWRDLQDGNKTSHPAVIEWRPSTADGETPPDVVVLRIDEPNPPEPRAKHRFGELPKAPTDGSARGFPRSAKGSQLPGDRIEHDQPGRIHFTSLTRRALTIDATGRHELVGRERWAGLSGGPLLANGLIVGVMREVPDGWFGEAVEAEPLAPLFRDNDELRNLLNIGLPLADPTDRGQLSDWEAYTKIGREQFNWSEQIFKGAVQKPSMAARKISRPSTTPFGSMSGVYYSFVVPRVSANHGSWRIGRTSSWRRRVPRPYGMPSRFDHRVPAPATPWSGTSCGRQPISWARRRSAAESRAMGFAWPTGWPTCSPSIFLKASAWSWCWTASTRRLRRSSHGRSRRGEACSSWRPVAPRSTRKPDRCAPGARPRRTCWYSTSRCCHWIRAQSRRGSLTRRPGRSPKRIPWSPRS
jgi:hypothetical protein